MSMRLPILPLAELNAQQRDVYHRIVHGPRSTGPRLSSLAGPDGGLIGPFNAMLYAPTVGEALQALGAAVRYGTSLTDRARELAILAVAHLWDSAFERRAHEAIGRSVGLGEDVIEALRAGGEPALDDPTERVVLDVARALLTRGDLDDEAFAGAREALGLPALVELSTLVGYYGTLALQMRIFRVGLP
jgi:4-carboxymuconolactone decarboxylase